MSLFFFRNVKGVIIFLVVDFAFGIEDVLMTGSVGKYLAS